MTAKPTDINKIFASNAPTTSIKDPDIARAGKYQLGWIGEKPPYQTFNYAQNKVDRALSHINEYGVAEWDSVTSYPIGGWARSTVDNEVYVSLSASNQNNEPSVSSSQWISLYSAISNISSPAGSVMSFASSTPPSGWVECDGSALSRTTYVALFTAIGTTYGTGDGSTTFNLPDLRGEFLRGWDNGRGVDSGRALGSWQDASKISSNIIRNTDQGLYIILSNTENTESHTLSTGQSHATLSSVGNTNPARTIESLRPRNKSVMYCIKY